MLGMLYISAKTLKRRTEAVLYLVVVWKCSSSIEILPPSDEERGCFRGVQASPPLYSGAGGRRSD